jgi:hypothetical protein
MRRNIADNGGGPSEDALIAGDASLGVQLWEGCQAERTEGRLDLTLQAGYGWDSSSIVLADSLPGESLASSSG